MSPIKYQDVLYSDDAKEDEEQVYVPEILLRLSHPKETNQHKVSYKLSRDELDDLGDINQELDSVPMVDVNESRKTSEIVE